MSSAYERERLARIRANEAFLAELDVAEDQGALQQRRAASRPAKTPTRKRARKPAESPALVRRSARQRGEEADSLYVMSTSGGKVTVGSLPSTMTKKEADPATYEYNLNTTGAGPVRQRTRFEEQVLDLGLDSEDMSKSGEEFLKALAARASAAAAATTAAAKAAGSPPESPETTSPTTTTRRATRASQRARGRPGTAAKPTAVKEEPANAAASADGGDCEPSALDLSLAKRLAKLSCSTSVKLTPSRVYSVAFCGSAPLVCLGDRDGNLGLHTWDAEDPEALEATLTFRPHVSTINVIQFAGNTLYTLSYDGTIRSMDLTRPGKFSLTFSTAQADLEGGSWLQHGQLSHDHKTLVLGDSSGTVLCVPVGDSKPAWRFTAHDKKVQTVSLDSSGRYLCTASLDRSIKLWDIRKPTPKSSIATFEDTHSVSSCVFNGTGTRMVAVGMSNKLHLFGDPATMSGGELKPTHSVRHDNRTGRYLAVFHAAWDPKDSEAFAVGSMLQPRRVEVFGVSPAGRMSLAMNLAGDALNSVQSRNAFHPTLDIIACANASGRLHLFR